MNRNLWIGLAVLIVVVIAGYFAFAHKNSASGETVKVGAALGLTGFCNTWGEDEQRAIELAIDEANASGGIDGRQITLVSEDTQCDAKGTVSAVQKLLSVDRIEGAIGPTWGDSFSGGDILFNQNKVVAISPSAAMEALAYNHIDTPYFFSTWYPQKAEIDALLAEMQKNGVKTVGLVHDQDSFGLVITNLFKDGASSHGIQIIDEESLPIGDDDFRTTVTKLAAVKPDALFTSFTNTPTKGKFLEQMYQQGTHIQLYSTVDIQDPDVLAQFGSVLNGIIYTAPENSGDEAGFDQKFKDKFGVAPTGTSVTNAYDATRALIAALTDHYKNGTDMKTAVEHVNVVGVTVPHITFNQDHQISDVRFKLRTVRDGQFADL